MALTQYDLSRAFWNFTFENPELVKPTHIAIFFFAVEHCNRLGWKEKFGLPTSMVIDAIGLKSYNSYKKHFDNLVSWGFISVKEYSKNQYSSNVIALSKNNKADNKAFDRAIKKYHSKEQSESESTGESTVQSTGESTGSIDKPITNNIEPITTTTSIADEVAEDFKVDVYKNLEDYKISFLKDSFAYGIISQKGIDRNKVPGWVDAFNRYLIYTVDTLKPERDWRSHFGNWITKIPDYRTMNPEDYSPVKDAKEVPATGLTATEQAMLKKYQP